MESKVDNSLVPYCSTCIMGVTVHHDGIGDFNNIYDFLLAVKKTPALGHIRFIPVVYGGKNKNEEQYINEKLKSLNMLYFYDHNKEGLANNAELIALLQKTDQVIWISADIKGQFNTLEKYLNPKALIKSIGEHGCGKVLYNSKNSAREIARPMGLRAYGIKIKDIVPYTPEQAGQIIEKNDKKFFDDLLRYTQTNSFIDCEKENIIVPAYFNRPLSKLAN